MRMRCVAWGVTILAVFALSQIAAAQQRRPGAGRGPTAAFGGGYFSLLRQEDVRKELELVEEQENELAQIGAEMREQMRELFSGLRDVPAEQRREKMAELRDEFSQLAESMRSRVDAVLLPNQRDRLQQLMLQAQLRQQGTVSTLTSPQLAERLGLSDEQVEELKQKEAEVTAELQKEIQKLRAEAREKLLEVLSLSQRQKLEELLGQQVEFDLQSRLRRGGGRGGFRRGGGAEKNPED